MLKIKGSFTIEIPKLSNLSSLNTPPTPEIGKRNGYWRKTSFQESPVLIDDEQKDLRRNSTLSLLTEPSPKKAIKNLNINKNFMELITKTSLKLKRKNNSIENTDEEIKQEKKRLSQMIASYFNKDQYMRRRGSERKRSMTQWPTNHANQQQINSVKFPSFATLENKSQTLTAETLPTPKNSIKKSAISGKLRKIRTEQNLSKRPIKTHPKRQIKLKTAAISGRKSIGINCHQYNKTCEINVTPVSP